MTEKYDYHKRNDYPGERVAERKRVEDRAEAAGKRCDARVSEKGRTDGLVADNRVARKGRMDDALMDSEIERSTAKAARVDRARNNTDAAWLVAVVGILILLIAGLGWSYLVIRQQSKEIDSLKVQSTNAGNLQFSDANNQVQLYSSFLILAADTKEDAKDYIQFKTNYSTTHELCADSVNRSNNINLAMNKFAEKEISYYKQIDAISDKPLCKAKIDAMSVALANSKAADERYYLRNMNLCGKLNLCGNLKNGQSGDSMQWRIDLRSALDDATAKAKAFTSAEKDVIACLA